MNIWKAREKIGLRLLYKYFNTIFLTSIDFLQYWYHEKALLGIIVHLKEVKMNKIYFNGITF